MISGCERDYCVNPYCKKNPNFKDKAPADALKEAVDLMKSYSDRPDKNIKDIVCDPAVHKHICNSI